ncbi:baseplate hub assembly protein [Pectobacterium phage POP12]|nr:baseplate hub assembly protein [Pectobacterium phage POP12]
MIDVIRVKLPSGIKRFKMFTVEDQLRFLLTSADMENKPISEQYQIMDEVLDILYPGYSKTEQEYIFSKVYIVSFGKNAIKVQITKGNERKESFMVINDFELINEYKVNDSVTLGFNFPKDRKEDETMFLDCISYILHEGTRHEWNVLSENTKNDIVDLIDFEDVKNIIALLKKSCHVEIHREVHAESLLKLFRILFSKSEIVDFFKTNFLLNKNGLNIDTMMNISPMERSIYVSLLSEDLKKNEKA